MLFPLSTIILPVKRTLCEGISFFRSHLYQNLVIIPAIHPLKIDITQPSCPRP